MRSQLSTCSFDGSLFGDLETSLEPCRAWPLADQPGLAPTAPAPPPPQAGHRPSWAGGAASSVPPCRMLFPFACTGLSPRTAPFLPDVPLCQHMPRCPPLTYTGRGHMVSRRLAREPSHSPWLGVIFPLSKKKKNDHHHVRFQTSD